MEDRKAIRDTIARLLGGILDEDDVTLEDTTTAESIDGWDSIAHVKLIIALEKRYKIRFAADEITAPENVGGLVDLVCQALASKAPS